MVDDMLLQKNIYQPS